MAGNVEANTSSLSENFIQLKTQFEKLVVQLKGCIENSNEKLNNKLKFIKEEVEIRVESIKTELDLLAESLITQFNEELKTHWDLYASRVKFFEDDLNILNNTETNLNSQADIYFNEYQTKLDQMNELINSLNNFTSEIEFNTSTKSIDSKLIGDLQIQTDNNNLLKRLKHNKPKVIDIDSYPSSIYSLEYESTQNEITIKKKFLYLCDVCAIKILDENFNIINSIQMIDGKSISPNCLTSNRLNYIYISDLNDDSIVMCDFNFRFIKKIGSSGDATEKFDNVSELAYSNQYLYVCDRYNSRIQRFNANDLTFSYALQFDYEPEQIKIYNNIVCVLGGLRLYFYDLYSFNLISRYNTEDSSIGLICNYYIYELGYDSHKFKIYSLLNGCYLKELSDSLNEINSIGRDDRRCLTYFDGRLVVSLSEGKLCIF